MIVGSHNEEVGAHFRHMREQSVGNTIELRQGQIRGVNFVAGEVLNQSGAKEPLLRGALANRHQLDPLGPFQERKRIGNSASGTRASIPCHRH